jgi:hypothetical protein
VKPRVGGATLSAQEPSTFSPLRSQPGKKLGEIDFSPLVPLLTRAERAFDHGGAGAPAHAGGFKNSFFTAPGDRIFLPLTKLL